jgi:hypothetical protein
MIIVRLLGGLGNQMFQYAAARRLAFFRKTELKLDVSFLEGAQQGCTPRAFELKHFNINATLASPRELEDLTQQKRSRPESFLHRFRQITGQRKIQLHVIRERHFHFDPSILYVPDNSYLEGFWQSERYFEDTSDILRREFTVKYPLSGENLKVSKAIHAENSVSIHIRRGDYVHDEATRRTHGVCGLDFYLRCVDRVAEKVLDPHFFIFSDEPEWAREHFRFPFPMTFVTNNGLDKGYEDLRLMSLCRHNIVANSSLSWWGAWLNGNSEKIVIAPAKWLEDERHCTFDIIPDKWQKM